MLSAWESMVQHRAGALQQTNPPTIESIQAFSHLHDAALLELWDSLQLDPQSYALVAVGGYGRSELCWASDLDVLLVHEGNVEIAELTRVADSLWYPLWDTGIRIDHSVRDFAQARRVASEDIKAMLGLIDARTVCGNHELTSQLRSAVLSDWRASAKTRLSELEELVAERRNRHGELAHLLEPDLKEAFGGLREATILRAIAASWVTDIDHRAVNSAHQNLLIIRDALHRHARRSTDRLTMHEQGPLAQSLDFASDDELLMHVSLAGRALAHASDVTWHRVSRTRTTRSPFRKLTQRRVERQPLIDGLVIQAGEVVFAKDVEPQVDSNLPLRAAAATAQAGLILSPHTVQQLEKVPPLLFPWSSESQSYLVSLLGAGAQALPIINALDHTGLWEKYLPSWSNIHCLPQRNALHRYTVDRHSWECAFHAAEFIREVSRPDLLLVAALYHDIGKGSTEDHCERGAQLMKVIAPQLGFNRSDTAILTTLVRHHLLLAEYATRRDLDDPATIDTVARAIGNRETLHLLRILTQADSLATNDGVWSEWKSRLVADLVARVSAKLDGQPIPEIPRLSERIPRAADSALTCLINAEDHRIVVQLAMADRVGLVAAMSAVFAIHRLDVRSAQCETVGNVAYQEWELTTKFGDIPNLDVIRHDIENAMNTPVQLEERLERLRTFVPQVRTAAPQVLHLPDASQLSTVFEIRAHDQVGLLHQLSKTISETHASIVGAKVTTLGSEVIDVLYVQSSEAGQLNAAQTAELVQLLQQSLST